MLRELELRIQIIIAFNDVISYAFITNNNSNYSIKWTKKKKSLTITKRMQI